MINFALTGFVFFGLFSPGPNVILVTASGARFGWNRTIPHILGIVVGVGVIAGLTGLGIGQVLSSNPNLFVVLQVIACCWILWMAYQLWRSSPKEVDSRDRPFTFVEALLFQWVNPKIWAVALTATAFLADQPPVSQAITLGLTFSILNLFVCSFWTGFGSLLSRLLVDETSWRIFMRIMAVGLVIFSALIFA
ncbi:Threonine/homoserine/homoserine lactone efflux protein [Cognatiyoonia sediminum]|uniref:Threonine/homoserine/homoserine lactone efflux protein n=1 Tax=Cognatiyoonia sediminum TaxID=1508389 RepID=A0A1M5QM32_9RHOB|nr:LysE family translocator [Cognatiyoonia sediminum]SHH15187.1 Threonine/homoserine/homoserine lactone efflux protein [Cognatiyoonia sediminum]